MIYVHTKHAQDVPLKTQEILRYLGYGKTKPDVQVANRIAEIQDEMIKTMQPRACCMVLPIVVTEKKVDFGYFSTTSKNLSRNLKDCNRAFLFAATIGTDVDRLIWKHSSLAPSSAVIAQAVATTAIESFCDLFLTDIAKTLNKESAYLRPRFSPGYGDFPLEYQKELFSVLDVTRKIGVSLTDTYLMTPTKSVTAVVGVSQKDTACEMAGCESCNKKEDCPYRRG